jgi:UDP-N-acetylglucosamine--N-acetylmuramyl-(pentapeptide) pyrophosphoryl-undecaprenol N-acetylglucosamine transferase
MPALAVAEALRERSVEVAFVTARGRAGAGFAEAQGFPEDSIPLQGFHRSLSLGNLRTVLMAVMAVPRAFRVLHRRQADAVVTGGGYMAGPVGIAAFVTRRPIIALEADARMGLANRIIAPICRRVVLAFPVRGRTGRRYVVTGRPVRRAVRDASRTSGRRRFGIAPYATVVLVVGGSQGARSLNRATVDAFGPNPPFEVIHVAGPRQLEETRALFGDTPPGANYRLEGFLVDLPEAIAAADLVVSRAGGSVFELAALGRPSILVPYPHATADHQTTNAQWLVNAGAAITLADVECTGPRLRELVGALLSDRPRLETMGEAARSVGRPEAADRIASLVLEAVSR